MSVENKSENLGKKMHWSFYNESKQLLNVNQ